MSAHSTMGKAIADGYVVLIGFVVTISDVLPGLAVLAALVLSLIRIINEWPQLVKTVKGWFGK